MASFSKAFISLLFLLLLVLCFADARLEFESHMGGSGRSLLGTIDCSAECTRRCSLASRKKICLRACGTCCNRCGCVPPGTYGNKEVCPCYARMTTHGGALKCP
ncbi:Gibberellin-regulated protein 1 [Acorus gramineus]|uniref:Gibberellin-regulated protein 1 n=1 Tax=Acorus gramineus TaxID=55184 RepID=A0AAV9AZS6_ACOGR|nr:Gibberellin-regulated protein 1 [Acorus gramineus]